MKWILSPIAFLCLLSAQADVIIYKQNIVQTQRQDGYVTTERYTGWIVIDLQTGQVGLVKAFRNWVSTEQPDVEMAALLGMPDRLRPLGIISVKDGEFAGLTARGINRSLSIGLSTNWTIPRTLTVRGSHLVYTNRPFLTIAPRVLPPISLPPLSPISVRTNYPPTSVEMISVGMTSQTISGWVTSGASSQRNSVENHLRQIRSRDSSDEVAAADYPVFVPLVPPPTNHFSLNRGAELRFLREFRGALIFDRENTVEANSEHLDLATTLLQFKQILLNKGYFDWDNRVILTGAPIGTHLPPLPPLPTIQQERP